jgi:hypothetical protein
VSRFWDDAASIFQTATAVCDGDASDIAILVSENQGLRIVNANGWALDALRREYSASAAYTVKRTAGSVVVEAGNGMERCTMQKRVSAAAQTNLLGTLPHHLYRSEPALLA